jgi:3'-phosphoadenosine 5'-phosphosulfate synthase
VLITEVSAEDMVSINALKFLDVDIMQAQFIQTIGEGFAFPLKGFMSEMELLEVLQMQTLTDETGRHHLHSVPITQHVTTAQKNILQSEKAIALRCGILGGDVLAVIREPVFYANRKEEIATRTFGTWSKNHPYVENIMEQGDWLVSGKMTFTKRITMNDGLDQYRLTPQEISNKIKERGADAVYAFQVRNPLHNGHVMLLNDTREQLLKQGYKNPILLLHPLGGWCKDDDVPLDTRML